MSEYIFIAGVLSVQVQTHTAILKIKIDIKLSRHKEEQFRSKTFCSENLIDNKMYVSFGLLKFDVLLAPPPPPHYF